MAITFNRRCAHQLRSVFRRAFGSRGPGPAVCFTAVAGTLSVKASMCDVAVEHRIPQDQPAESLWLPFQFLDDCAGKKDEPVHVEPNGKDRITAQWRDGSVPQIVQYEIGAHADAEKFPTLPETMTENPPDLLEALTAAGETCDPDSVRYALGHLQLGHDGTIRATDGRQLLVQTGFTFPWDGDLLIPRSRVFASPELAGGQSIMIGAAGEWLALRSGPWTIWLKIKNDGKFPDISRHIPAPAAATAHCALSAADAEFLADAIPRLPGDQEFNFPITLDLNGSIAVRAKAADQACLTELLLRGSRWSGEPIRVNTNRQYLARAVKLGFQELFLYGNKVPVLCQDARRRYVWALLEPDAAIPPADNAIRIESPSAETDSSRPNSKPTRRTSTMSEPSTSANGHAPTGSTAPANGHAAKTNGRVRHAKAAQQDITALIEQATKLRTALHNLMYEASGLVKALKQHRRQNRAIQTTLASLKQLKTLGV